MFISQSEYVKYTEIIKTHAFNFFKIITNLITSNLILLN